MSANIEILSGLADDLIDAKTVLDASLRAHNIDPMSDPREWPLTCRVAMNNRRIAAACLHSARLDEPYQEPELLPLGVSKDAAAPATKVSDAEALQAAGIIAFWLGRLGTGFNPTTHGSEYVNVKTGANALNGAEQAHYERDMKRLCSISSDPEGDVLEIVRGMEAMRASVAREEPAEARS